MPCQGCEARREWLKKQAEIASERFKLLLQRLNQSNDKDNRAK